MAPLQSLPAWLLDALLVGALGSLLVAALFAVAVRRFPRRIPGDDREPGGTARRRAEIRAYLDAIDEHYAEGHPVAGQDVAFYLPTRDVAITFDARAYYRIAHTDTHPVLVEHELPGVALGSRLPFETPAVPESDDDADPREAALRVLGLPPGADHAAVQRAYRDLVKEVHPDHGGDEAAFRRVREAYATAAEHAE